MASEITTLYDEIDSFLNGISEKDLNGISQSPPVVQELGEWGDDREVQELLAKQTAEQQINIQLTSEWNGDADLDELLYKQTYAPVINNENDNHQKNETCKEDQETKYLYQSADCPSPNIQITKGWNDNGKVDESPSKQTCAPVLNDENDNHQKNETYKEDQETKYLYQSADCPSPNPQEQQIEAMDWSDCEETITIYPFEEEMEVD